MGIDLQGVPCKPYRVWVCSAGSSSYLCVLCQLHTNFSSIDYLFVLTKVHERVEGVIKVFKEFIGALFGVH